MPCIYKRKMYILFWYVLFVSAFFAQENKSLQSSKVANDSTEQKVLNYKLSLSNSEFKNKSPLLLLGKHYDPYLETFNFVIPEGIQGSKKSLKFNYYERERIRNEINRAMKVYRDGQLQTDLGIVGQVLGYTETAAAFGLAIYHLYKFRKKK